MSDVLTELDTETIVVVQEVAPSIIEVVAAGPMGPRGPAGDINPQMPILLAATEAARDVALASEATATTKATVATQAAQAALASEGNALASATASAGSATTASTKANEASTSAQASAASVGASATSASNAADSATLAANKATAAGDSATLASTKASEASTSAGNASASATAANTSATNASGSATTATTKAGEATTSATNASNSAATATTKAGEANTSATNAANSATTATTKAGEAAASATTASNAATTATTQATNAGNSAIAAAISAGNAADSAAQAAASASSGSTHAVRTDNPHGVTKTQVGLGNVDNTSDANKPVSTATQAALDSKTAKTITLPNGIDLNTVVESGFYRCNEFSNGPIGVSGYGQLIVSRGLVTITQIYSNYPNGNLYTRAGSPTEVGGSEGWSGWGLLWSSLNDGSGSGLDADRLDGLEAVSMLPWQSQRDFANGTLIQTSIDYSQSTGDPFLLEITGNSYNQLIPFDIYIQGYIYDNTIISHGGLSNGTYLVGLVAINYGGKLCFWFPRQGYWDGFTVAVYRSQQVGLTFNVVTSITDSAKPGGATKEVNLTSNLTQSLHSGNVNSYAVGLTGDQTINGVKTFGSNTLFNGSITVGNGQLSSAIYMVDSDEGSRTIHCNSNRIGFLRQDGNWGSYCTDDGSWISDVAMQAPIFYGSLQGNANSATNADTLDGYHYNNLPYAAAGAYAGVNSNFDWVLVRNATIASNATLNVLSNYGHGIYYYTASGDMGILITCGNGATFIINGATGSVLAGDILSNSGFGSRTLYLYKLRKTA